MDAKIKSSSIRISRIIECAECGADATHEVAWGMFGFSRANYCKKHALELLKKYEKIAVKEVKIKK